jgi:hypothetical protein
MSALNLQPDVSVPPMACGAPLEWSGAFFATTRFFCPLPGLGLIRGLASGLSPGSSAFTANLAYAYAVSGMRAEAMTALNDLKNRSDTGFSNAPQIALVYVGLNDRDQAIVWLEKAYAERFRPWVLIRPAFDPLLPDPRFRDLLRRLGLRR